MFAIDLSAVDHLGTRFGVTCPVNFHPLYMKHLHTNPRTVLHYCSQSILMLALHNYSHVLQRLKQLNYNH